MGRMYEVDESIVVFRQRVEFTVSNVVPKNSPLPRKIQDLVRTNQSLLINNPKEQRAVKLIEDRVRSKEKVTDQLNAIEYADGESQADCVQS